ncbi:MAG: 5-bromo-4-chloroindolyl phosphate hydrolysis family protein [Bradyrhizobium sp.]|uniref:5-bromo-4-chloroindolyl phosphate hydrolysis family protein n=1 Tax=Bradyrhizobium sp. TaxID=376 RepID=UPI001D60C653|nr:5-bromo-4-chloroindolyl phosphate hydrolysis family protein [Bradyrhizobium sp.]MBV9564782.1 5-bromo-4-chloroindolyl phosphate hydrolysis family protein [Bradyrhizobium sp.]
MAAAPSGQDWIVGGAAAAVLLPLLAIGVGMPFWIACVVSALAGGGIAAVMAPKKLFAQLDASGVARGRIEFARDLLTESEPLAGRMEAAATAIKTRAIAERVRHLVKIARDIFSAIERDPLRIDRVKRFLSYYLPRAAEIAEAYAALEKSPVPDAARLASASEMIDRLDTAFTRYAASLQDADLDRLDIELKLLKRSLDEDLGPALPSTPSESKKEVS